MEDYAGIIYSGKGKLVLSNYRDPMEFLILSKEEPLVILGIPIVMTGSNGAGERLLVYYVGKDIEDSDYEVEISVKVTEEDVDLFVRNNISLFEILKRADKVGVIKRPVCCTKKPMVINIERVDKLPASYIPPENSYIELMEG